MDSLRRLGRGVVFVARGLVTSVFGNMSLALLSVALAFTLWLYVTDRENPKQVEAFNSALPIRFVNVPNDLAVANASEANVRIRVEATKSDLNSLRADDFDATVNLGGLDRGVNTIAVDVKPRNGRLSVVEVTPPRIDVTLEDVRTKEVPVRVAAVGSPQQGFAAIAQTTDPVTATVTGPESLVALVDNVSAEVNLTGLRVDFTDRVELRPRDVRGGEISRMSVSPARAQVNVDIEQREVSIEFAVNPLITGQPASGYNAGAVTVDPRLVTVTGPLDVLQSIDAVKGLSTEEISVADSRSDVIRTVQVTLPPGTRIQGATTVRVTVAISAAKGEATFQVVPQIRNLGDGLAVVPPAPVTVTLAGEIAQLNALSPGAILVSVDADRLAPGLYSLPAQVTAPAGLTVVRVEPGEVGVAIITRP